MAFNIKSTLKRLQSLSAALGGIKNVLIGEPKQPPPDLSTAIWMNNSRIVAIMAGGDTGEGHMVTGRFYKDMLGEPTEGIELGLADAAARLAEDWLGDYDLGGTIRCIDAGGIYGQGVTTTWGYVDVSGKMHRVVDIDIPMIVDASAVLVQ